MTETILISGISAMIGGVISFTLQFFKFRNEIQKLKLSQKTDFSAESAVIHYLSHKSHIDRSFKLLHERMGGFEEDELRKILVRAGAVRNFRDGDESDEWWRLLSRNEEYFEKKRLK